MQDPKTRSLLGPGFLASLRTGAFVAGPGQQPHPHPNFVGPSQASATIGQREPASQNGKHVVGAYQCPHSQSRPVRKRQGSKAWIVNVRGSQPPSVPSGTINPVICCGTQRLPDGARGTIVRALMAWLESQTTDQPRDQRGDS